MENGSWLVMFAAIGMLWLLFVIIGIIFYVLYSVGLYKLSKNSNIEYAWLSWIPVFNLYILGKLIKSVKISEYVIPSLELVLPISFIIQYLFRKIPLIGFILQLAYYILVLISLYKLYSTYRPKDATLWIVLSVFIIPIPILLFIMRNDSPVNIDSI